MAPGFTLIEAEGEVVSVPGMLGNRPAGARRNSHTKRCDEHTAAQFQKIGIDDGANVFVGIFFNKLIIPTKAAKHFGPQIRAIDIQIREDSRPSGAPSAALVI